MKSLDKFHFRPSTEGLSKEQLLVNPFPDFLSEEEFCAARKEGKNLLKLTAQEIKSEYHELVERNPYEALPHYDSHLGFEKDMIMGSITEDFQDSILTEDPILATEHRKKAGIAGKVFKNIGVAQSDYGEKLNPDDKYVVYALDSSGKILPVKFAAKKNDFLRRKLGITSTQDLIAVDTLVFLKDFKLKPLSDPEKKGLTIKPTHSWLQKPTSQKSMIKMITKISGKNISIVTGVAVNFKVLRRATSHTESVMVETMISIRELTKSEIDSFVEKYFTIGKNIAGGVDYTSYGAEITNGGIIVSYDEVIVPIKEIKKLWAKVQTIKRSAQLQTIST